VIQDLFGVGDRSHTASDAKRNIEPCGHVPDPVPAHGATVRARRDVVKHDFIGAVDAILFREFEYVSDDAVVAELYALDDLAVADVEAGNYAAGRND
jgi:hypothetical protein